jgi:phosphoenolpyruvate-protein phosphotransferase
VPAEHRRFLEAIERSYRELKEVESRVLTELGQAQSAIFAAHLGMLRDKTFAERVRKRISRELVNVEQAVESEVADLCQILATVENEYIKERAQDIRDVANRVMRQLNVGDAGHYMHLPPQSVIVARELLPSETVGLDRRHVAAIITEEGGETGHAAILARALGIPAVTGVTDARLRIPQGAEVLVDGQRGRIAVAPSEGAIREFAALKSQYDQETSAAEAAEGLECVTLDGTRATLLGNINRPHETHWIAAHHLDGVGLFRTEFMFLDSAEPPSFQRQIEIYGEVMGALAGRPLTIRTLDLGDDKMPAFLERQPGSGMLSRGLKFALAERRLFETQVGAIIAAAQDHSNVRILLPMVLGPADLRAALDVIRSVGQEMGLSQIPPVGAMIETPASLFALEEILQLADFVSVGTNDLTQYMLAADRNATEVDDDFSVLHPGVLRGLAAVVQAAGEAGREVCVCGESASYARTAGLLFGLGIRQLSMSPVRAARVRRLLRNATRTQLEDLAGRALRCDSTSAVRTLLDEELPQAGTGK